MAGLNFKNCLFCYPQEASFLTTPLDFPGPHRTSTIVPTGDAYTSATAGTGPKPSPSATIRFPSRISSICIFGQTSTSFGIAHATNSSTDRCTRMTPPGSVLATFSGVAQAVHTMERPTTVIMRMKLPCFCREIMPRSRDTGRRKGARTRAAVAGPWASKQPGQPPRKRGEHQRGRPRCRCLREDHPRRA